MVEHIFIPHNVLHEKNNPETANPETVLKQSWNNPETVVNKSVIELLSLLHLVW